MGYVAEPFDGLHEIPKPDADAVTITDSYHLLDLLRPGWWDSAACRNTETREWFPGRGHHHDHLVAICASCPVITTCRRDADDIEDLGSRMPYGVRGGLTGKQRRIARRKRIPYVSLPYPVVQQ